MTLAKIKKNSEWIHIGASLATIVALGVVLVIFWSEISLQRQNSLEGHISDMESLKMEINKNIEIIHEINNKLEENPAKLFQLPFVYENIKDEISDGMLLNERIKSRLIVRYVDLVQYERTLEIINSPEFRMVSPENWLERKSQYTIDILEELNRVEQALIIDIDIISEYITCLETNSDFSSCSCVGVI